MAEASVSVAMRVRGKQRPKFGRGRTYTPKETVESEKAIRHAWRQKHGDVFKDWKGPVRVSIEAQRPIPSSRPKSVAMEDDTFKPDLDNIAKLVLDALVGTAFADDKQVVRLDAVKRPRARDVTEGVYVKVAYLASEEER